MKKKPWKKPQLIVLFRGRPEEAVLQACKAATTMGPGANQCRFGGGGYNPCSTVTAT